MAVSPERPVWSVRSSETAARHVIQISPLQAGGLVAVFALGLIGFGFLDVVRANPTFQWSFLGPGAVLLVWNGILFGLAQRGGRVLRLEISFRSQHCVQAIAQATFFVYWGWFWSPLYDSAFLIAAQLVFAYAFTMLLCWSRRDLYMFGLGPFPVIFSINLFLWFTDNWFYLQFLLVALGFLAKEFIQWNKGGQRVHIFNPSSLPLAVFSAALIATGTSDLTWGQDIATSQFFPPHVYLVLFFVALPAQYLFGVASMTLSAVLATYIFGLVYFAATGVYFFYDSYIPIAVFLGMQLLFTDPSTAPRTEVGRIIFGVLYGLSTVVLYALLTRLGVSPFYDKLLQVPVLNLSIQALDRIADSKWLRGRVPGRNSWMAHARGMAPRQRNLAYMALWGAVFVGMSAVQGVGDRHPGQWVPFWQEACRDARPGACRYLRDMQFRFCRSGSAWACNEAGMLHFALAREAEEPPRFYRADVVGLFERSCGAGFAPGCQNLTRLETGAEPRERASPPPNDYPIILRGTKGPLEKMSPAELLMRACGQGWDDACDRVTEGGGE